MNYKVINEVIFEYGSKNKLFKVTPKMVFDLTNKKEFHITTKGACDGKLNFNNEELYNSGRVNGITLSGLSEDVYSIINAMIKANKKDAELVEFEDNKFREAKDLKKNNLGRTFSINNKQYAYKYN